MNKMKTYSAPITEVLQVQNTFAICDGSAPTPVDAPSRATVAPMTSIAGVQWI